MELAKDYVRHLVHSKSERVSLVLSDTMRSAVWTCFYKIFVDGYQTSFVVCRNCGHILKYTPKDGTTAMRIHMGKFCGRMKAKAVQGTVPQTPLVPTATASGSNGSLHTHGLHSSSNVDEPLDLQKPQLKTPMLASAVHNNNNNTSNINGSKANGISSSHHQSPDIGDIQSQASPAQLSNAISAAAAVIANVAAAASGNSGGAAFPSLSRASLHGSLPMRQMTPTARAQEILSAFNPIPPSALPTPKMLYLPGAQSANNNGTAAAANNNSSSSPSNTPTSPTSAAAATSANAAHARPASTATGDGPCNLVVRRPQPSVPSPAVGHVTNEGIEAVAVAFKAALGTFDDDLREVDNKIQETESQLDKLRSKRLNLLASREHVNKAARVVLNSVDHQGFVVNGIVSPHDQQPVDAMIEWVRRHSSDSGPLKRSAPVSVGNNYNQPSPLSNWPADLQMQFSRGPKRLRKAYTAVRRGVPSSQVTDIALGNATEIMNGVVPMTSASPSKSVVDSSGVATGSENGTTEAVPVITTASDGSSVANTPPSSEYLAHDDEHDCNDDYLMSQVKPEINGEQSHQQESDVLIDDSNNNSMMDDGADSTPISDCSSLQLVSSASLLVGNNTTCDRTVLSATVTPAFVYVGTSDGCVIRYDVRSALDQNINSDETTKSPLLITPFADEAENPPISCMESWLFGHDNDDDFAVLFGTENGVFRIYNPEMTNVLCEKKLNWAITALCVVAKRRLVFVGLKMGVLVSVDLDKMELAAKIVCGFGSIVDVDWLPTPHDDSDFMLFVATEDGTVSVRDSSGQVISNVDLTKTQGCQIGMGDLVRVRAVTSGHRIFVLASSQTNRNFLIGAQLDETGESKSMPLFEVCRCDESDGGGEISQFGQFCANTMFSVDNNGKLSTYRFIGDHSVETQRLMAQDVFATDGEQSSCLAYASIFNDLCYLISSGGHVKIYRLIAN